MDMFGQRRYKERNVRDGNLNARERYGRLGVHIASEGLVETGLAQEEIHHHVDHSTVLLDICCMD